MIKSILVCIDGSSYSRAARDYASYIGSEYDARLVGLYVLDVRLLEMPPYLDYSYPETIPLAQFPVELLEGFREKGERILDSFRESVSARGVTVEAWVEEGVPAEVIGERAEAHDLVVMGKRGEHAQWGRDLLGATTESVVRRAETPVLLAGEEARPLRRSLLLYDGSAPANRGMKLAADLATHLDSSLNVFTSGHDLDEAGRLQEEAHSYLEAFSLDVGFHVHEGETVTAALGEMEERPADLVIMGTQGHSALRRLILGSTAEQLMRAIPSPVLLVP